MAQLTFWIITISRDQPISDVARCLQEQGFTIQAVLEEISCITGAADEVTAQQLKHVKGVVSVAPDTPMDVGPPGSGTVW